MTPPPSTTWNGALYLIGFTMRRTFRVRQMLGITLGMLVVSVALVTLFTASSGWDRFQSRIKQARPYTLEHLAGGPAHAVIDRTEYLQRIRAETTPPASFARSVVFLLFLGFLLPIMSLSFATGAFGHERESRSLIWLTTRPLPRSVIYLAKFLGVLPWCVLLNVGGFGLLCLAGGSVGRQAFVLYAPGILGGTLAFAALFHLFGATLPRPAVLGLLYSFFFETLLSELPIPGTLKRLSINYYVRCLLYDSAQEINVPTESASLFVPVSPTFAWSALLGSTVALTLLGMWIFAHRESRDDT